MAIKEERIITCRVMRSSLPKKLYGDTHSTASAGKSLREEEKGDRRRRIRWGERSGVGNTREDKYELSREMLSDGREETEEVVKEDFQKYILYEEEDDDEDRSKKKKLRRSIRRTRSRTRRRCDVCVYLLISCHKRKESLLVMDKDELASTPFCRLSTLSTAARGDNTFNDPPDHTYLCRLINLPWCVSMFTREYIVITGITSSPVDPVDPVNTP